MICIKRSQHNPLLTPLKMNGWEDVSTCNGCPIQVGEELTIVYRAISEPDRISASNLPISSIGKAILADGLHPEGRERFIIPTEDWEKFGCEDPRITKLNGKYYIFYTALSSFPLTRDSIKIGVAISKDLKKVSKKSLVTHFNSKGMALFPKKINGKMVAILTTDTDYAKAKIAIAEFESESEMLDPAYWRAWYKNVDDHEINGIRRNENDQVEVGAPPIHTPAGWLIIYSHIQEFFSGNPLFGIEALLLDLKDPRKIIGKTNGPLMIPQEMYEEYGIVSNIVFPTGAIVTGDELDIYYGASDTTTCRATLKLSHLLEKLKAEAGGTSVQELVKRYEKNPILTTKAENAWEARDVFNPAAIDLQGSVHVLYRAMSKDNTSTMGYVRSKNGFSVDERLSKPAYFPRADFEKKKNGPECFSGCEDPRLTQIGDTIHLLYTAYDGQNPPRVASSSISTSDFLAHRWQSWSQPELLTPGGIDDKDACLLPKQINGKYCIIHRVNHHICLDYLSSLDFSKDHVMRCIEVFGPRRGMWDGEKVGIGGPPLLTKEGWLMLYHGVSHEGVYRVGAALLKIDDPTTTLARTSYPIFEPKEQYELSGQVKNVVFPCGNIIRGDTIYLYYGGADSVVGVATLSLSETLSRLNWKSKSL